MVRTAIRRLLVIERVEAAEQPVDQVMRRVWSSVLYGEKAGGVVRGA